jgi:hypothetical protein
VSVLAKFPPGAVDGESEGDADADGLREADGLNDGDRDVDGESDGDRDVDGLSDAEGERDGERDEEGLRDADGESDGEAEVDPTSSEYQYNPHGVTAGEAKLSIIVELNPEFFNILLRPSLACKRSDPSHANSP